MLSLRSFVFWISVFFISFFLGNSAFALSCSFQSARFIQDGENVYGWIDGFGGLEKPFYVLHSEDRYFRVDVRSYRFDASSPFGAYTFNYDPETKEEIASQYDLFLPEYEGSIVYYGVTFEEIDKDDYVIGQYISNEDIYYVYDGMWPVVLNEYITAVWIAKDKAQFLMPYDESLRLVDMDVDTYTFVEGGDSYFEYSYSIFATNTGLWDVNLSLPELTSAIFTPVNTSIYYGDNERVCSDKLCYGEDHFLIEGEIYSWVTPTRSYGSLWGLLRNEYDIDDDVFAEVLFSDMIGKDRYEKTVMWNLEYPYDTCLWEYTDRHEKGECSGPIEDAQQEANNLKMTVDPILLSDQSIIFHIPNYYGGDCQSPYWLQKHYTKEEFQELIIHAFNEQELKEDYEAAVEAIHDTSDQEVVTWLYKNEITKFEDLTAFWPNNTIRRDEMAAFLDRAYYSFESDIWRRPSLNEWLFDCEFLDLNIAHSDLIPVIIRICERGIFKWAKWEFMPVQSLTNEQALAVILRQMTQIQDASWSDRSQSYYDHPLANDLIAWTNFLQKEVPATRIDVWIVFRRAILYKLLGEL